MNTPCYRPPLQGIDQALQSAGKLIAGFQQHKEKFREEFLKIYCESISDNPQRRAAARDKAFALVHAYALVPPISKYPTQLRERTLIEMGVTAERCLAALDESECRMTLVREWNW